MMVQLDDKCSNTQFEKENLECKSCNGLERKDKERNGGDGVSLWI